EIKLKKIYCKVKIKDKDSLEKECENNNNSQLNKTVSNQSSLHDFINKKTPLPISKQDKITNRVLA
ncbi:6696_t:CDS:2, partial [Gigaspora rosea]